MATLHAETGSTEIKWCQPLLPLSVSLKENKTRLALSDRCISTSKAVRGGRPARGGRPSERRCGRRWGPPTSGHPCGSGGENECAVMGQGGSGIPSHCRGSGSADIFCMFSAALLPIQSTATFPSGLILIELCFFALVWPREACLYYKYRQYHAIVRRLKPAAIAHSTGAAREPCRLRMILQCSGTV